MPSLKSSLLRFLIRRTINWNKPLEEIRIFQQNIEKKEKIPKGMEIEKKRVENCSIEIFIPENAIKSDLIVYFHGGGYCLGIVHANRNFIMRMADRWKKCIMIIDYRLAPEHPFPAALDDCTAVLRELQVSDERFKKISCLADSSGCGLCLATLGRLHDEKLPMPSKLAFMCPVVDLSKTGDSFITKAAKDPMQLKEDFFIDRHYTLGLNVSDPRVSPIFADFKGFPDTLIQAADYDVFHSDSVKLFEKLTASGVNVKYSEWQKMWHNFQLSEAILPEGKKAMNEIFKFLN